MDVIVAIIAVVALLGGFLVGYLMRRKSESEKSEKIEQLSGEVLSLTSESAALRSAKELLASQLEEERLRAAKELELQRARWREDFNRELEIVSAQLKNETNRSNRESITEIMRPYQQQLEELKKQSGENRATLETHIKTLVETGGKLSSEADRLARALSSDVRMQGNLGEKLLEDLLAGSGLVEGKQYLLQRSLKEGASGSSKNEDTGKAMKPDAMIFYPATKSVLYIDSKFQLPADIDFENTSDSTTYEAAIREFRDRLRTQYKALAARGYQKYRYEDYISLPYVIMFVPSDKALMAVTSYDKTLWLDAFNSKVFIASERHLLMLIEMISVVWVQQQQLNNQENIVKNAEILLNRVAEFISHFDKIGKSLDDAQTALKEARAKGLGQGQTISVAANNIISCGVKAKNQTRQAQLEEHLTSEGL